MTTARSATGCGTLVFAEFINDGRAETARTGWSSSAEDETFEFIGSFGKANVVHDREDIARQPVGLLARQGDRWWRRLLG